MWRIVINYSNSFIFFYLFLFIFVASKSPNSYWPHFLAPFISSFKLCLSFTVESLCLSWPLAAKSTTDSFQQKIFLNWLMILALLSSSWLLLIFDNSTNYIPSLLKEDSLWFTGLIRMFLLYLNWLLICSLRITFRKIRVIITTSIVSERQVALFYFLKFSAFHIIIRRNTFFCMPIEK